MGLAYIAIHSSLHAFLVIALLIATSHSMAKQFFTATHLVDRQWLNLFACLRSHFFLIPCLWTAETQFCYDDDVQ